MYTKETEIGLSLFTNRMDGKYYNSVWQLEAKLHMFVHHYLNK